MANLFRLEVYTPYRHFLSDMVEYISLNLSDGGKGILANHSPFVAPVQSGILRIKTKKGEWRDANISSGIVEVTKIKTVLLVDDAQWLKNEH